MASDSETEWFPKYSAEVPWRLNVEVICGSVPWNTGLRASQKRTVFLSEYVLASRNFCFRTDHGNSNKGGKWPVPMSPAQAALGSAVLRLGTVWPVINLLEDKGICHPVSHDQGILRTVSHFFCNLTLQLQESWRLLTLSQGCVPATSGHPQGKPQNTQTPQRTVLNQKHAV